MIIRWMSKDGKHKWLYPIKKDVYSDGDIVKQKGTNLKVIGVTKVNIPSPFHPIIPYYVLLLEDEHGNRMPKKTMKHYRIGDRYVLEKATKDDAVVINKIKYDLGEYLRETLSLLSNMPVTKEDKVLIKPTIIEPAYPYQASNTNPKILHEVITFLKELGINDIVVAEQAMPGHKTEDAAKKAGIISVCEKHAVPFIDLATSTYVEKEIDGITFSIAQEVLERKIINLPVMKTHAQLGISGAMENLIRVTDLKTQRMMYTYGIHHTLPKLAKFFGTHLCIGDASSGVVGQGPTILGEPGFFNMFMASLDAVALDACFAEICMITQPTYITEAGVSHVGNANLKQIPVIGDEVEACKYHVKRADPTVGPHPHIAIIDGMADPAQFNAAHMISAKLVGLLGHPMHIAMGTHITPAMVAGKERIVAYGNEAAEKLKELGVVVVGEINERAEPMEKLMMVKSILEDPDKKSIGVTDKVKSKVMNIASKIQKKFA